LKAWSAGSRLVSTGAVSNKATGKHSLPFFKHPLRSEQDSFHHIPTSTHF
jgi:hypothetical protein